MQPNIHLNWLAIVVAVVASFLVGRRRLGSAHRSGSWHTGCSLLEH